MGGVVGITAAAAASALESGFLGAGGFGTTHVSDSLISTSFLNLVFFSVPSYQISKFLRPSDVPFSLVSVTLLRAPT